MARISVDRLYVNPGLLSSAKYYRLELVEKTLYVIEMSKAAPRIKMSRNSLNGYLIHKLVDLLENRFSAHYSTAVVELEKCGPENIINRKNCFSILNVSNSHLRIDKNGKYCIVSFLDRTMRFYANTELVQAQLIELSNHLNN